MPLISDADYPAGTPHASGLKDFVISHAHYRTRMQILSALPPLTTVTLCHQLKRRAYRPAILVAEELSIHT
jgi:hypothetical protein